MYEDDEPVEEIAAAFERGEKGLTGRPRRWNLTLDVPWPERSFWPTSTTTNGGRRPVT